MPDGKLLNPDNDQNFDNGHYENIQQKLQGNDVLNNSDLNVESLNSDITYIRRCTNMSTERN